MKLAAEVRADHRLLDGFGQPIPPEILRGAAESVGEWMRRGPDRASCVLRERQWLRGSAAGEIIVMPMCFRADLP